MPRRSRLSSFIASSAPRSRAELSHLGRLEGLDLETVNRLMLQIQSAHLQLHVGAELDPEPRREARGRLVREALRR